MSEFDEETGYLVIKPGDRVFIEYDNPNDTEACGGWATVLRVKNAYMARVLRDKGCGEQTYCRMLFSAAPEVDQ